MNLLLLKMVAGRIVVGVLSLLAVSIVVFTITALLPGDAAQEQLGQDATPEALAALRAQMGLNKPGPMRYWEWLSGIVRGDPGESSVTHTPIASLIGSRLPNSLLLVPGYSIKGGEGQGGKSDGAVIAFNDDGFGSVVNASRGIIAAWQTGPFACDPMYFAQAAANASAFANNDLNAALKRAGKLPW